MSSNAPGPSKQSLNPYQTFPSTNTKNERLKFSSAQPFVPTFVESHLSKSRNLDPKALYENRVKNKPILLENPARDSRLKQQREETKSRRAKERERKKLGLISKKEARFKALWRFEKSQRRYELFVPLHHLWLGYMSELLGLGPLPTKLPENPSMPNSASMHPKLVKADFHGSILRVKQAKNPCLVGLSGIVVHETENAFKVISIKDQLKLIPKQGSIFTFRIPLYDVRSLVSTPSSSGQSDDRSAALGSQTLDLNAIPQMEFELYGNQFRFRAAERAGRKFKPKDTIEL
ncbi:RNase P/MRP, p29 subunit [Fomitiporia mediterranea MF3/22]|uniref:RNase P/MRP, p29 subunit n=1 Tax=Fomitiporia mediterranea (strain MF3/22) TaxID=694068 RepID=UPI0004409A2C|nr:RNase P/MRP, p29 subunit [Fomitiporia mediterranea MF3/22]EJD06793.1 RNase P/MRP, p29 subunit [Fomitiporia mediterranea MF3/22]